MALFSIANDCHFIFFYSCQNIKIFQSVFNAPTQHCKEKRVLLTHFGCLNFIPFSTWLHNFIGKVFTMNLLMFWKLNPFVFNNAEKVKRNWSNQTFPYFAVNYMHLSWMIISVWCAYTGVILSSVLRNADGKSLFLLVLGHSRRSREWSLRELTYRKTSTSYLPLSLVHILPSFSTELILPVILGFYLTTQLLDVLAP